MDENNHETSLLNSSLVDGVEQLHYPLPLIAPLYGQIILLVTLVCGGFLIPVFYQNEEPMTTDTFSAVVYFQIICWALITMITWHMKAQHKLSRTLGYHEFYASTRHFHRVAFYFLSGGNVLMLLLACLSHNFCLENTNSRCSPSLSLTPVNYLQIIIVIEVVLTLPIIIRHFVEVIRFNREKSPPDVLKGHLTQQIDRLELIVGIRGANNLERLLEQQAEELITLNCRNQVLCSQLYALAQRTPDPEA